jgi:septal ring factor EnvC (AmiA/AmiB activator)
MMRMFFMVKITESMHTVVVHVFKYVNFVKSVSMTERIRQLIDEISRKAEKIHLQLLEERERNSKLTADLQELGSKHNSLKEEFENRQNLVESLHQEVEKLKSQVVDVPGPGRNDQEIDELVKEIEYCISQLKR